MAGVSQIFYALALPLHIKSLTCHISHQCSPILLIHFDGGSPDTISLNPALLHFSQSFSFISYMQTMAE